VDERGHRGGRVVLFGEGKGRGAGGGGGGGGRYPVGEHIITYMRSCEWFDLLVCYAVVCVCV